MIQSIRTKVSRVLHVLFLAALAAPGLDAADTIPLSGRIVGPDGGGVPAAQVSVLNSQRVVLAQTSSDGSGAFILESVPLGRFEISVEAPGFASYRRSLEVTGATPPLQVALSIAPRREEVTVTADPGRVEETGAASQQVNVISQETLQERASTVTAQALQEEEGLFLQRTSPTISGVFVRGLTGNKVSVFVDGVRYSTGAMRGGINTFFNLVDVNHLEAIEVLRGPNSARYGSDALGGSVQLLTQPAPLGSAKPLFSGDGSAFGSTSDASFGSSLRLAYGARRFGIVGDIVGHRANRLRPGAGLDSHSAFTRFFGVPSSFFLGGRLPDTGFTQYGGMVKTHWAVAANARVTAMYMRNQQDNGKRYDQLLGGDGNLIADLRNLMSDVLYLRFDQQKLGPLDLLSLTYSYDAQREERVNQGGSGNPAATIGHEPERTAVHGVQGFVEKTAGRNDLLFGADYYHERLHSRAFNVDPATLAVSLRRPRVPHNAKYQSGGAYVQDSLDLVAHRLRLLGAVRYSAASYRARSADSPPTGGAPLWPDDSLRVSDWTFRLGLVGSPTSLVSLYANFSRGFRAPHMTDLGTLGVTGAGFEVAAPDVRGRGATVGSTADAAAVSTGLPVTQLQPETSLTYEAGARLKHRVFAASLTVFINDINNNITKQTLILPPGAVGQALGGQPITRQNANGAVFVAAASNPVLVRANFDDARLWGVEHQGEIRLSPGWSAGTVFTYLHAADTRTGLPPNLEGGTPAPEGYFRLRYEHGSHWWIEPYLHAAARQDRLSSLDLEDRRTGATRTRESIRSFFRNGATARGFVGRGADGTLGTDDDVLLVTGETLLQIQDRVLGAGVTSSPLYRTLPGYVTFNLRGGVRIGERQRLFADFANIGDRNYRGISWGVDAPGRSFTLRYTVSFGR